MGTGRWLGVALLAGAAALYLHSRTLSDPSQAKAIETALSLAVMDRQVVIPEFTAASSGTYLMEIQFQTAGHAGGFQVAGPQYLLSCMAGITTGPTNCKDQPDVLDVTWSVASDGTMVALGSSSDFEGEGSIDEQNRTLTRLIGRFQAHSGDTYLLKLNLHLAPPDLAGGDTKLLVRPDASAGGVVPAGFESILTVLLGGGGLAMLWMGRSRPRL